MSIRRLLDEEKAPKYDLDIKVHSTRMDKENNQLSFTYPISDPAVTATIDVEPQPNNIRFYIPTQLGGTTDVNILDGGGSSDRSLPTNVKFITGPDTVNLELDNVYIMETSGGALDITLPTNTDAELGKTIILVVVSLDNDITINASTGPGEVGGFFPGYTDNFVASYLLDSTDLQIVNSWKDSQMLFLYARGDQVPVDGRFFSGMNVSTTIWANRNVNLDQVTSFNDGVLVMENSDMSNVPVPLDASPNIPYFYLSTGTSVLRTEVGWARVTLTTTDASLTDAVIQSLVPGEVNNTTVLVTATDGTDSYVAKLFAGGHNIGGTTSQLGATDKVVRNSAGAATWDSDISYDDATDVVTIEVTGEAGKTINWKLNFLLVIHDI